MSESEQNLRYLKQHPLFPFQGYRADELQYMSLELYWLYLFKEVIGGNASGAWQAWHPPDQEREGNPIFSAVNLELKRGVRVIQHQPEEGQVLYSQGGDYFPFQPYLNKGVAEPFAPELEIVELCFLADVSEESERRSRELWKLFCVDLVSEPVVEELIQRYEDEVRMPGVEP